jgi:hypothetical protein
MATIDNPLKLLLSHWDRAKVAKRFGVSPGTVSRWRSQGVPATRRHELSKTANRVSRALERAAINDDWAREQLTRWTEAGNAETEAMAKLRELNLRQRRTKLQVAYIQTWQGLLAEATEDRRELAQILKTKRFRNTPTGRQVKDVQAEAERYAEVYHTAIERGNPREISNTWKAWERQVQRLLEHLEDLQIPGMSKRQVYTLFFSP